MIRTRAELLAAGIPASTIDNRCRNGDYQRLLPGVLSTEPPDSLAKCRAIIAWLPEAVLSHRTAAWLWGMLPEPARLEATVPKPRYRTPPPWLHFYRGVIPADWVAEAHDLPTTHPALTLLNCLSVLPAPDAESLIDEQVCRSVHPQDVLRLCDSGLRGGRALREQLRAAAIDAASEPERIFARALKRRGLNMLANHPVGPYRCDFVDERSRTIVEIDGREFHSAPGVFRRDRRRQNQLVLDGWLVLRYAAGDVLERPEELATEVVEVVRRRRRSRRG
ncbi:DUF559 domain-containing protein [Nocardia sp. CDC153]|uniref:DUF559 domain-containing protein n=1 Tax=Nocardia sp. CDC153 TaxID=3112167 RepID=UPI002DB7F499|nr:DUF559 domain-containing protein [Nocardia sp. CDC153]MEC3952612.1 DUF559 domain-containing protein [Nocardia sp. CDC153]